MPRWGEGDDYDQTLTADIGPEGQVRSGTGLTKGQILWLRGITRLQTQVCHRRGTSHGCLVEGYTDIASNREKLRFYLRFFFN